MAERRVGPRGGLCGCRGRPGLPSCPAYRRLAQSVEKTAQLVERPNAPDPVEKMARKSVIQLVREARRQQANDGGVRWKELLEPIADWNDSPN